MQASFSPNSCINCPFRSVLFKSLREDELIKVNENKQEQFFKRGEIIAKEGDEMTRFFYLREGLIKIYKEGENRRSQIISITTPKDFIGLTNLFSSNSLGFSVSALEDSLLCSINSDLLITLLKQNNQFAFDILRMMGDTYNKIITNSFEINRRHLRGRIAYIIIYFSEYIYKSREFDLPVSRKEMAEMIEMTTENVIRILSEFRKDGVIEIDGKKITILNFELLQKISRFG